tara:strand:+ start:1444 stop:1584 length:141 start_codon:yes stop_codon:yes gene_type:complete
MPGEARAGAPALWWPLGLDAPWSMRADAPMHDVKLDQALRSSMRNY